jgi:hypothetical protein
MHQSNPALQELLKQLLILNQRLDHTKVVVTDLTLRIADDIANGRDVDVKNVWQTIEKLYKRVTQ